MKSVISSTRRRENLKTETTPVRFNRPTLITLTAPTCSGKSFLLNELMKTGKYSRIVSTTTRPARDGEVQGVDYDFISLEESRYIEKSGGFAELIEFRSTRYGVTHAEMEGKLTADVPPIVIVEPQGLAAYEKLCQKNNWGLFAVYVYAVESLRIERLNQRTVADLQKPGSSIEKLVATHTDRLLSITGDERRWSHVRRWDSLVPGDDARRAVADIEKAIEWKNRKDTPPLPYHPV